jgi:hypothetical protein
MTSIFLEQEMKGQLSKIWMPLEQFTALAMEGLKRGDMQIPIGMAKLQYDKFEVGKVDVVKQFFGSHKN